MEKPAEQTHSPATSSWDALEIAQLLSGLLQDFEWKCKHSKLAGISHAEARVLLCFTTTPTLSVTVLASRLNSTAGWASRISAQLLVKGFLICFRKMTDRRVLWLQATDEAIEMIERAYGPQRHLFATVLDQMQPEELTVVAGFLRAMTTRNRKTSTSISQIPRLSERRYMVRQIWQSRPFSKQRLTDVPDFYRWLQENRPRLLKRNHDPYPALLSDLDGCIQEEIRN